MRIYTNKIGYETFFYKFIVLYNVKHRQPAPIRHFQTFVLKPQFNISTFQVRLLYAMKRKLRGHMHPAILKHLN